MEDQDPLRGDEPKPDVEGNFGAGQILLEPLRCLEIHLLDHIGDAHPPAHTPVEAEAHHAREAVAVPFQQRTRGRGVAARGEFEEMSGLRLLGEGGGHARRRPTPRGGPARAPIAFGVNTYGG